MSDREPKIYLLPNLMTAGNLLSGFIAILYIVEKIGMENPMRYHYAIGLILLACLFDALDGRFARLSGQSSDFGREFDSIADIVSFGIAPALLVHDIVLGEFEHEHPGLGWLIACGYLVCGAMRLARFNCLAILESKEESPPSTSFRGCPIPAAAGMIVSLTLFLLWWNNENRQVGQWKYVLPVLMVLLSYLMVSNVKYPSFKALDWKTKRSFHWVLIAILLVFMTIRFWQWMPMVLFIIYLGYGLIRPWVSRKWRKEIEESNPEDLEENGDNDPASLI